MSDIARFGVCWEKFSEDGWPGLGERLSRIWIDCECSWEHRVWLRGKQFTRDRLVIGCNKYSDITFYTLEEMEEFCYTMQSPV